MPPSRPISTTAPLTWTTATTGTYTVTEPLIVAGPESILASIRPRVVRHSYRPLAEILEERPKTKFTWASWSNMWEKVAEAHEKKVYCIKDEPPTVTPVVPEPVKPKPRRPRIWDYDYEPPPF